MEKGRWRKGKKGMLFCMAAAVGLASGLTAFGIYGSKDRGNEEALRLQEEVKVQTQEEKLTELKQNEGLYSEDSIVLADTDKEQAEAIAKELGAKIRMTKQEDYAALYLPEGMTIQQVYESDTYRAYLSEMSPDYYVSVNAVDARGKELFTKRPNYEVDDAEYGSQEYLDYINLQDSWNTSRGGNVTVAVIDTGIDTDNTEFAGRISEFSYNASTDKAVKDYDLSVIEDEQGHGTAVAGVLAATMNNGAGIAGLAPEAELVVIKCECDESGRFTRGSDLVFGLAYAIERDVDVVNMSFGTPLNVFEKYTKLAADSDIICVAAAGNEASSLPSYPAADEHVIGVGALDTSDWSLAAYSNFGDNAEVLAPGTVYTTALDGGYKYETGTSLSSPLVAAAVALYRTQNAHAEFAEVQKVLWAASTDLGSIGEDWYCGFGNLDVYAFLCEEKGTITYDMLTDEIEGQTQVFVKGHTVQYMPEPERESVVFDGWYYDRDCTDEVEYYEDVFTGDLTLFAKWINEDEGSAYLYTTLPDGTVEIQSYTGKRRYLSVPQTMEGKTVTSIGEGAFADNARLRSVTLPATITKIGGRAFLNCTQLRSMDIPEQVEIIGESAFYGCARLAGVGIAKTGALTEIGNEAFAQCGISAFDIPVNLRSLGSKVFFGSTSLGTVRVADGNVNYKILNDALYNAEEDTLVYYPAAKSGEYAVNASTKTVGEGAFAYSRKASVALPEGVREISDEAFVSSVVRDIQIPGSVTRLGSGVFRYCNSLQQVVFAEDSKIGSIPSEAFCGCFSLQNIEIPASVRELGMNCFSSSGIQKVAFKGGSVLETIGFAAFANTSLTGIKIPANTKSIDWCAFFGCSQLGQLSFEAGSRLQSIGQQAFFNCRALSAVVFPDSLESVGQQSFFQTGLVDLGIGKGLTEIGDGAFSACPSLERISVEKGNPKYASFGDVLYNTDKTELVMYPAAKRGTYTLADETVLIRGYAFAGAQGLTDVVYNANLHEIGESAFSNCSGMVTPNLPAALETIGGNAFEYCHAMETRLTIPAGVKNIGRFAFFDDFNLTDIRVEAESVLSRLGYGAFGYCGIRDFTIPGNVSSMGQEVFTGCKNLLTVTFEADSRLINLAAWTFEGAGELRRVTFEENSGLELVEARAFQGLDKLEKVDFTACSNLAKVGNYAFVQCRSLADVSLPVSVTEIGRYAFQGCALLPRIDIPKTVSFVGRYAFMGTGNINVYFKSSVMPSDMEDNWDFDVAGYFMGVQDIVQSGDWEYALTDEGTASVIAYRGTDTDLVLDTLDGHAVVSIGGGAFRENQALRSITLPKTLTGIYQGAFAGTTALDEVVIPENVQVVDSEAFRGSGIRRITFEEGSKLNSLGRYVFAETVNLSEVSLPDGVDKVKDYAFYKSGISRIGFGEASQLAEIGRYAFAQSALEGVVLPDGLSKVDYYAFAEARKLGAVTFGTGAELSLNGNAFYRSGLSGVSIPANVGYIGELCFTGCNDLAVINVDADNEKYASVDGVLLDKEKKKLITCPAGKTGSYDVASTVTTLAFGAFEESKLSRIRMPGDSRLGTIGYRAFYGCANLESMDIPNSVQSIDNYAFAECGKLVSVNISQDGQLGGIYKSAFYNCKSLTAITIPDTVQEISDYAFYGCSALTDVPISETSQLKGIYGHAFEYAGITSLMMPESLLEVGEYAFNGAKLATLVFNETITDVGDYAFADCGLTDTIVLTIPGTVEYLGKGVLKGAEIRELTIPFLGRTLEDIESENQTLSSLFAYSSTEMFQKILLEKVVLLAGERIGDSAFQYCKFLNSIVLPEGLIEIGAWAFHSTAIEEIELPNTLRIIGDYAFWFLNLKKIHLSENLESLGIETFGGTEIRTVLLPDSLVSIGSGCFADSKLTSINIPKNVQKIGGEAFKECELLQTIDVAQGNKNYVSYDGILYNFSGTNIISVPNMISGNIILPNSLQEIEDSAFYGCKELQSITLPLNLKSIGRSAFVFCTGLKSMIIPDSVKQVDDGCFTACSSLETVVIGKEIKSISEGMFANCTNLDTVVFNGEVNEILYSAFSGCNFETFMIPESVVYIGGEAFAGCQRLKSFYISETVDYIGTAVLRGCNNLSNIVVDENNTNFTSKDGILYNDSFTEVVIVPPNIGPSVMIQEGVTELRDYEFRDCVKLERVVLPNTLEFIGYASFLGCHQLSDISVGDNIKYIGNDSLMDTAYIKNPDNWENDVLYLGKYAIKGKEGIRKIVLKDNTIAIAYGCFGENPKLQQVKIPDSVKYINDYAFANTSLEKLYISNSVKEIGEAAFGDCNNLRSLELPDRIEKIGDYAFRNDSNLQYVKIGEGELQDISPTIFMGCKKISTFVASSGYYLFESPSSLVLTKNGKILSDDINRHLGSNTDIYSYVDRSLWDDDILNSQYKSKIHLANEWNLCLFYVDGMIAQMNPLKLGEVVQQPAESLVNEYLPEGATFIGWDINGDDEADRLPVILTEDLEAHAIYDVPITSISVNETEEIEVGRSITLKVTCKPDEYNHSDAVIWSSSDEAIATVDETGTVTGIAEGEAVLTATLAGDTSITASCIVTVIPVQYGIKLQKTSGELNVGDTYDLQEETEFILPDYDTAATQWSSGNETIAVIENGLITALAPGNIEIQITHGEYRAVYQLTVKSPLTGIRLSEKEIQMNTKDTWQLQLSYLPANTTDSTDVFWYSNKTSVARVDSNGLITAVGPGEATVTAMVGNIKAACKVTVKAPLKWIVLDTTKGTMRIDRKKQLEVIYEPSNTTDDKSVTWSSSDSSIASVDENGSVTALNAGTATITGTVGSLSAGYEVTVVGLKDNATGITVTNADESAMDDTISLNVDELDETYLEQEYTEAWNAFQTLMQGISDGEEGHIPVTQMYDITLNDDTDIEIQPETTVDVEIPVSEEALEEGAVIYRLERDGTITDMGAAYHEEVGRYQFGTEHFSVYVLGAKSRQTYVGKITLNETSVELCPGNIFALTAEILPEQAADTPIEWYSSNEEIATVTQSGNVMALKSGTAVITATANDRGRASAECRITIGHEHQQSVKEPTCTEQGYATYTCNKCGDVYIDPESYIEALGHSFGEWETVTSPTCTDTGSRQRDCSVCGYIETSGIDAKGHKWEMEYTIDQEPTCTSEGSKSIHCKNCEAVKSSEVIPAAGHRMTVTEAKEATCTQAGNTAYWYCAVCRKYFHDEGGTQETELPDTVIPPKGHDYLPVVTEPTCTEQGYTTFTCSRCADGYIDSESYVAAFGHSFGEWETVTSPTCTDTGSRKRTCNVCGYIETSGVDAKGHKWEMEYIIDQEPTCTSEGSKSIHCKNCEAVKSSEVIPAAGHRMTVTEAKEATCTQAGNTAYWYCAVCRKYFHDEGGTQETELPDTVIPPKGHDYLPVVTEPTCTEQGYTTFTCSRCADGYIDSESYVPAFGHSFGEWETVTSPTCTDIGSRKRICNVCGYIETSGVDAKGHNWESGYTVDKEPACATEGSQSIHCKNCEAIKDSTPIPAAGHTFGNAAWKYDKESHYHTCTVCQEKGTAGPHTFAWITDKPATEAETGIKHEECSICGYRQNENTVTDKLPPSHTHTYETITQAATLAQDGSITTKCTGCGDTTGTAIIYRPVAAALMQTVYTYTGKEQKPGVTVTDSSGAVIPPSSYTITYTGGKSVGAAFVQITFTGNYSGMMTAAFTVNPKGTVLKKLTAGKKNIIIKWKKQKKETTGYEIQYSTGKKFTKKTTSAKTVKKASVTKLTINKLKAGKDYYVRIRTYKTVKGQKYYSGWSKAKKVTTKK